MDQTSINGHVKLQDHMHEEIHGDIRVEHGIQMQLLIKISLFRCEVDLFQISLLLQELIEK